MAKSCVNHRWLWLSNCYLKSFLSSPSHCPSFLHTGAIATCLLVVLGISSLPSVTATLSWREFTFIQSKLGWVALIAAASHDVFLAWHYMFLYWGCFRTLPIGPQVGISSLKC